MRVFLRSKGGPAPEGVSRLPHEGTKRILTALKVAAHLRLKAECKQQNQGCKMKAATVEKHSDDDFQQVQNEVEPALPQLSGLEVTKKLSSLANNAADSRVQAQAASFPPVIAALTKW